MVGTSPVPLIPEASKEDLEKLSLELSAAEPRPYPDPAALELPMSVPSTSGSEDLAVGQDDASVSSYYVQRFTNSKFSELSFQFPCDCRLQGWSLHSMVVETDGRFCGLERWLFFPLEVHLPKN